jgi:hypothetical protein
MSRTRHVALRPKHHPLAKARLAESGAGDEVIVSIAGHVCRAMLSRYSHVRMEAKRRALDEIAARQRAAQEKRKQGAAERQQVEAMPSQAAAVVIQ